MKKDNFNVHKWNHRQKLAGIINESNPQSKEYTIDDFILKYDGKDFFDPFLNAIYKDQTQLDPDLQEDWNMITNMSAEELKDNYGLTPEVASKVKNVFDNELNEGFSDSKTNLTVKEKVKNFLNNEIFSLEGMDDFNMREKMLNDVNNTIEEEIDEFVRRKFREERYTSSRKF
jgi:hypothetical protein